MPPARVIRLVLAVLLSTGCTAEELSRREQTCVECALRRRDAAEAQAAAKHFERRCRAGDAGSCSALGVMLEEGRGVARDARAAASLYLRACQHGNRGACLNLGRLYESGATGEPDRDGAEALYQHACDDGVGEGCYQLGRLRYERGDAVRAARALDRGCAGGDGLSCEGLGLLYQRGAGVPQDAARARELFTEACKSGTDRACQRL